MKKLFLTMLLVVLALGAVAQEGKFTLTGAVKGQGMMTNYILTNTQNELLFSSVEFVTADKVNFSYDLEEMGMLMMYSGGHRLIFPAVPGEEVTINGDVDNYSVDGSAMYQEYNQLVTATRPLLETVWKYDFKQACQAEIVDKSTEEVFDLYQSKLYDNYQPVTDAVLSFVREHADRESSMMALNFLNYAEDIEKAGDIISEQVLEGRMSPYYEAAMKRVTRYGASNPLLHKTAPDFNLKDVEGKALSLSSLRGKWVFLNFWLSTCGNAVSQFPALKEMYDKYKDHVVFIGVDCVENEDDWKSAVSINALPWVNVYGDMDIDDPQNPMNLYHEIATPAYFLIAPSGKLAMKGGTVEDIRYIFDLLFE